MSLLKLLLLTSARLLSGGNVDLAATEAEPLRPESFDIDELKIPEANSEDRLDSQRLSRALARYGVLAVRMRDGFADLRKDVLAAAAECIESSPDEVATVNMPDSTVRRTIAAESNVQGDGKIKSIESTGRSEECHRFRSGSERLRAEAAEVATAFGARLSQVIESSGSKFAMPALEYRPSRNWSARPFAEMARRGPRVEHFHAYEGFAGASEETSVVAKMRRLESQTLGFHADQGLFVVFSPGMMVNSSSGVPISGSAGDFQVRCDEGGGSFGTRSLEVGGAEGGSLLILLGDAVRQLGLPHAEQLFHVPSHAFRMPEASAGQQRLWYGLMQLPPADLVAQGVFAPSSGEKLTFGEIRKQVGSSAGLEDGAGIGCSPVAQWSEESGRPRRLEARLLSGDSCTEGQAQCWHRCMELPNGVSETACADTGSSLQCVISDNRLFNPDLHVPDAGWELACGNATEMYQDAGGSGGSGGNSMGSSDTTDAPTTDGNQVSGALTRAPLAVLIVTALVLIK